MPNRHFRQLRLQHNVGEMTLEGIIGEYYGYGRNQVTITGTFSCEL